MDKTVEVLSIGREILDGRTVDTNAHHIGQRLKERGLIPRYGQRVDDDIERVVSALQTAFERSDIVIATGGLGPTSDDLTAEAFARYLGEKLVLNQEAAADIRALLHNRGRPYTPEQEKQAMLPASCQLLKNSVGVAPGFVWQKGGKQAFFLPGVPNEMRAVLSEQVLPRLPEAPQYRARMWSTQFIGESDIQAKLRAFTKKAPPEVEITYQFHFPENRVGLHCNCVTPVLAQTFEEMADELDGILAPNTFAHSVHPNVPEPLEYVLMDGLKARGYHAVTVESCTGGLVAHKLTNVSGSSEAYWGSFVTYDNEAKCRLGVKQETLKACGAVSLEVASEMALAGKRAAEAAGCKKVACVATTGIAGPNGGSPEKPVGLCFVAVAIDGKDVIVERVQARLGFTREENKIYFAQKAMDLLRVNL